MNDTKEKSEKTRDLFGFKAEKSWTYKLTFLFLGLTLLSVPVLMVTALIGSVGSQIFPRILNVFFVPLVLVVIISGFVFFAFATLTSLISMIVNFRSFGKLVASFFIFLMCCIIWSGFVFTVIIIDRHEAFSSCRIKIKKIGTTIVYRAYNDDNFKLTNQWCDDLLSEIGEEGFVCSNNKGAKSNYALNKNVVGKNLDDLRASAVLIFESVDGWNLVGGPELISYDNHGKYASKGCNIFFVDCYVEFFTAEQIKRNPQIWEAIEKSKVK